MKLSTEFFMHQSIGGAKFVFEGIGMKRCGQVNLFGSPSPFLFYLVLLPPLHLQLFDRVLILRSILQSDLINIGWEFE